MRDMNLGLKNSDDHFLDGQIDLVVLVRHAVIFIGRCMILQKLLESLVDFTVYLILVEGHNGAPLAWPGPW